MNEKNNDFVMINLDKPRQLRLSHKVQKTIKALTGKSLFQLDIGAVDPDDMEKCMFAALSKDDPELTLERVADLMDEATYGDVCMAFIEAVQAALGKNLLTAAERGMLEQKRRNGTGKNP